MLKKLFIIIISIITLISGYLSYYYFFKKDNNEEIISNVSAEENDLLENNDINIEKKTVYIDIKGAVLKPGVYEVEENTIINDAIKLAGGFNKNAYKNNINLSKKVSNEMVIYVLTNYEYQKINTTNVINTCKTNSYTIDECKNSSIIEVGSNELSNVNENKQVNKIVNINTASIDELQTLPGIKETRAKAIIDDRNLNGLFKTKDDITRVSGIGTTLYEKIKEYITV